LKQPIIDRVGDLDGFEISGPEVLLAIYERDEKTPGGIIMTAKTLKEDVYQGKAHLILKIGPGCDLPPGVGLHDWVVVRPSDGWALDVNMRPNILDRKDYVNCRLVLDNNIRAKIAHPSMVW
jgi:hypothetical protein